MPVVLQGGTPCSAVPCRQPVDFGAPCILLACTAVTESTAQEEDLMVTVRSSISETPVTATATLTVETAGEGFVDITREAARFIADVGAREGALLLFIRHTSASLTIQENADPDVQTDLVTALRRIAPRDAPWVHDTEGPDDMPAHVKAMLTGTS